MIDYLIALGITIVIFDVFLDFIPASWDKRKQGDDNEVTER